MAACSANLLVFIALVSFASAIKRKVNVGDSGFQQVAAVEAGGGLKAALDGMHNETAASEASSAPPLIQNCLNGIVGNWLATNPKKKSLQGTQTPIVDEENVRYLPPVKPADKELVLRWTRWLGSPAYDRQTGQDHSRLRDLFWNYYAYMTTVRKFEAGLFAEEPTLEEEGLIYPLSSETDDTPFSGPYGEQNEKNHLGGGSFGDVYMHEVPDNLRKIKEIPPEVRQVAVKKIPYDWDSDVPVDDMMREIVLGQMMRNPNVLKLLDTYFNRNGVYLVSELMSGGDLQTSFDQFNQKDWPLFAQKALRDTAQGVFYMHQQGLIHRDLKLENVMLKEKWTSGTDVSRVSAKLIDFGMVQYIGHKRSDVIGGTPEYICPEIANALLPSGTVIPYSLTADVWSLGVMIWEMNFGQLPFGTDDMEQVKRMKVIVGLKLNKAPTKMSNSQADALDLCKNYVFKWQRDRITIDLVLLHPYFTSDYSRATSEEERTARKRIFQINRALRSHGRKIAEKGYELQRIKKEAPRNTDVKKMADYQRVLGEVQEYERQRDAWQAELAGIEKSLAKFE